MCIINPFCGTVLISHIYNLGFHEPPIVSQIIMEACLGGKSELLIRCSTPTNEMEGCESVDMLMLQAKSIIFMNSVFNPGRCIECLVIRGLS